jgi:diaminohydroxyphosphoribosylaminopyrimidine deaminase / 5-amino-6-(5-phosphoribosylamino)uracil reductase
MDQADLDLWHMRRALELAAGGRGYVEPNPMVGCVIVRGAEIIGEGWHRRFGGPHAEVEALRIAGPRSAGATMYVTLEPCCHQGKTPPCTEAVVAAGLTRVVVACRDPFPQVAGGGVTRLREAGIRVDVGLAEQEARVLNAPYFKLVETGRPWVIAKWAMTLDGKIATRTRQSRWISGEASRAIVHGLRGRVDAIVVGRETAARDDPQLTARPPGPRTPLRVVLDSRASLPTTSRLAQTAGDVPVLVAVAAGAGDADRRRLADAGCELFECTGETPSERLVALLDELGRRRMTNVLVEGGGHVLGCFLDLGQIDEVHVFIAPKVFGGAEAPGPLAGRGVAEVTDGLQLDAPEIRPIGHDLYIHGRVQKPT